MGLKLMGSFLFLYIFVLSLTGWGADENISEEQQSLRLIDWGFAYGHSNRMILDFAFIINNPNQNAALERNHYQATAYDRNETIIAAKEGWIYLILPGETLGVADRLVLPENRDIARIGIMIDSQRPVRTDPLPNPLTSTDASFIPHDFSPKVTGMVKNSMNSSITNVKISAILFGSDGKIIGGGSEVVSSVPPGIPIGVQINVATQGDPASLKLYTSFYEHSMIESSSGMNRPLTVENLHYVMSSGVSLEEKFKLDAAGFVQDVYGNANYGFVVENPDEAQAFHHTSYQATARDASGRVIGVASGLIPLTFPGEKMGVVGSLQVPEGSMIDRLEIVIDQQSADGLIFPVTNPLTSERASFIPSAFQPKVTAVIKNSLDKAIQYVPVSVIAYDDHGEINGVGVGLISTVAAKGESVADIYMHTSAEPARLELYPQITDPLAIGLYTP